MVEQQKYLTMSTLEKFCGGELWNETAFFNRSGPVFTRCFRATILTWVPCGFLWLSAMGYIPYLFCQPRRMKLPFTILGFLKLTSSALLMAMCFSSMTYSLCDDKLKSEGNMAVVTKYAVLSVTFLLTMIIMLIERMRGVFTSGVLFIFWTFLLTSQTSALYALVGVPDKIIEDHALNFYLFYFEFALTALQLLLHCFSDLPDGDDIIDEIYIFQNSCPETTASFPSCLVFGWMTSTMFQGFRKQIAENGFWKLSPRDQSQKHMSLFQSEWRKEARQVRRENTWMSSQRKILYVNNTVYGGDLCKTSFPTERTPLTSSSSAPRSSMETSFYKATFSRQAQPEIAGKNPSLRHVLMRLFAKQAIAPCLLKVIGDIFALVGPIILSQIIRECQAPRRNGEAQWIGKGLAVLLLVSRIFSSVFIQASMKKSSVLAMHLHTSCVTAIYTKILSLRQSRETSDILNLIKEDCQDISKTVSNLIISVTAPIQISIALCLMIYAFGWTALASLMLVSALFLCKNCMRNKVEKARGEVTNNKTSRLKLLKEVFDGMKTIKLNSWECHFMEKLRAYRRKELRLLIKISYFKVLLDAISAMTSFMAMLFLLAVSVVVSPDGELGVQEIFVTFYLICIIIPTMNDIFTIHNDITSAIKAISRIEACLCLHELDPGAVQHDPLCDFAIKIRKGCFQWERSPTLRNINLSVKEGSLVMIAGQLDSGRSSLLAAILGEMEKTVGKVTVQSTIAYVPEDPWIQSSSLRDNILFGSHLHDRKYKTVVALCELFADNKTLAAGHLTDIGANGLALTASQRQRVSLARALYSGCDIFLLDQPLSHVDKTEAKRIFSRVIGPRGYLKKKTRVLVTNDVAWLGQADQVVFIRNHMVAEVGSYQDLVQSGGHLAQFLKDTLVHVQPRDDEDEEVKILRDQLASPRVTPAYTSSCYSSSEGEESSVYNRTSRQKMVTPSYRDGNNYEKHMVGPLHRYPSLDHSASYKRVKWSVLVMYVKQAGFSPLFVALFLLLAYQNFQGLMLVSLMRWTEGEDEDLTTNAHHLARFTISWLCALITMASGFVLLRIRITHAAARTHDVVLNFLFHCQMAVFESGQASKIVNRLSRDINVVDLALPNVTLSFVVTLLNVIGPIVLACIVMPSLLFVIGFHLILYIVVQSLYIPTSLQLKQRVSETLSPIHIHFDESITGACSIRAYHAVDRFIEESKNRMDKSQVFYFAREMAKRWSTFYLDMIGGGLVFSAVMLSLCDGTSDRPAAVGLVAICAFTAAVNLPTLVQHSTSLMFKFSSVRRLQELLELPAEAVWEVKYRRLPEDWPRRGTVELCQLVSSGTCQSLDLTLRGLTCSIHAREKVGIIEQIGSETSDLAMTFYRLVEPTSGSIIIDDLDIGGLGLKDIRSRLSILPKDPYIFSGSLRYNLDPCHKWDDQELWRVLKRVHLRRLVLQSHDKLHMDIGPGQLNLSYGQRLLISVARALLHYSNILIVEDTSDGLDVGTEALIQKIIRLEFESRTIITITRRPQPVMDYDRVIVIENGCVKEVGRPDELLRMKSSNFFALAKSSGLV